MARDQLRYNHSFPSDGGVKKTFKNKERCFLSDFFQKESLSGYASIVTPRLNIYFNSLRLIVLGPLLLLMLSGCTTLSWQSNEIGDEKGEEKTMILKAENGQTIAEEALLEEMLKARVIYLGEKHDNPHHHQLQLALLEKLLARGKRPALGFEFFSREQTGWLMNFSVGKPSSFSLPGTNQETAEIFLRRKLGWQERPDWAFYLPLLQLARSHHLPIFGADLPNGIRVRLTRNGLEELSAVEKAGLSPSHFQHADYQSLMRDKLSLSHCGMASESLLDRLYATWIARNDAMAQAITLTLADLPATEPIVMILGSGHVANNMGVYERVAFLQPGVRQVNLGFQETEQPNPTLAKHLQPVRVGQTEFAAAHAFFWFTPAVDNDENKDPCAQMHRHKLPAKK